MAKAPSKSQVARQLERTQRAIDIKTKKQNDMGKPFAVTGAGVIPEKVWTKLPGKQEGEK